MERKMGKNKVIIVGAIALAVLLAAFAAVYFLVINPPVSGQKDIKVEIVHSDKTVRTVDISTDAEYLGQALVEKDLVEGTESATGLFMVTVDGETADWDKYKQFWGLYQDGEFLMTGVDKTPIKDGDKFEIILTVSE